MTSTTTETYDQPVTIPAYLLQYIDQEAIITDWHRGAADAYNAALDAAFPDGPPGGCGSHIDLAKEQPRTRHVEISLNGGGRWGGVLRELKP